MNNGLVVDRDKQNLCLLTDGGQTCYRYIYENNQIKDIVTKEQFDRVKFVVEE